MTKKDKIFIIVIGALVLIIFFPMFFLGKIIGWLDMLFYFLPFRELTAGLVKSGELPLWNPYIYCGTPLAANMQSAVFNPLNVFYYVVPPAAAVRITTFAAFFIMGFSMYKFMRESRVSEEGSLAGAALFSFTYYMLIKSVEFADLHVMAWMPAAFYFARKFSSEKKMFDAVLAGLVLSMSLLGGHPQVFLYVYLAFSGFFIYLNLYGAGRRERNKSLKALVVINAVLALVSAIQILPTLEFIIFSRRAETGLGQAGSTGTYARLGQILMFFFPFAKNYLSGGEKFLNWMGGINIGIAGVLLFALGAIRHENTKARNMNMAVFVLVLFIAFLGSMPFYSYLYENLRLLGTIRYPSKIMIILFFIICFYAGKGYDYLFKGPPEKLKGYFRFIAVIAAALTAFFLFMAVFETKILIWYRNVFTPLISFEDAYILLYQYRYILLDCLIYLVLFLIMTAVVYAVSVKKTRSWKIRAFIFLLLAAGIVIYDTGSYTLYAKYGWMKKESRNIKFLKSRKEINKTRILAPGIRNLEKPKGINIENYYLFRISTLAPNVPMMHGLYNADGFDSLVIGSFFRFSSKLRGDENPWDKKEFALLSTSYISSMVRINSPLVKMAFGKGAAAVYKYSKPLPMAYFVGREGYIYADNTAEETEMVYGKGFDPYGNVVMNEKDREYAGSPGAGAGKKTITRAAFSRKGINEINIRVNAPRKGVLVVLDNYYPGWKAYVDGKEKRIIRVNITFKGVPLEKGERKIRLVYAPFIFKTGTVISVLALFMALAAGIYVLRRK